MKKILSLVALGCFICCIHTYAQGNIKFGHINKQELLASMPEADSAQAKIQNAAKEFEDALEAMQVEFNNKYEEYMQNADKYSDLIRATKEKELQEINQRVQNFQMTAEQDLQRQRTELFQPIIDKANKAIKSVGEENNLVYIFDISFGSIVYYSEKSMDVMPLAKKKLGIE